MSDDRRLSTDDIAMAADRGVIGRANPDPVPSAVEGPPRSAEEAPVPLFAEADAGGYRTRWSAVQTGFVDEPKKAVEEADTLVAEVMKRLAEAFADERRRLEAEWEKTDRMSTEDLRQAMRRYRSFFERLLSV